MGRLHVRAKTKNRAIRVVRTKRPRGNWLLAGIHHAERRRLLARCELVDLNLGEILCEPGDRVKHVYFPIDGFISLISSTDGRTRLEVGLVGAEGMLGISLILGVHRQPLRALVQGAGSALRIAADHFSRELKRSTALRQVMERYLYVLVSQLAQMAACTRFHLVDARLARWILMTRDRAGSDDFQLTHKFMADMLGVRRAGVSRAAKALEKLKLIRYSRGHLRILDGFGLQAVSCGCYSGARRMYAELMK